MKRAIYPRLLSLLVACTFLATGQTFAQASKEIKATEPDSQGRTHADVAYGEHERTKLDFWQAEGAEPRPVVVLIHGGGWVNGSKDGYSRTNVFLEKGISVAAINYRRTRTDTLPAPVHDAARAVQFLRHKSKEWNIDTDRIAVNGESAGGCSALWIACHDDLAKPKSADPVERESSRVKCAAGAAAQVSIELRTIESWVGPFARHGMISSAVGESSCEAVLENYAAHESTLKEFSPINHLTQDDPPIYLAYDSDLSMPAKSYGHAIHHGLFGVKFKDKSEDVGHHQVHLSAGDQHKTDYRSPQDFIIKTLLGTTTAGQAGKHDQSRWWRGNLHTHSLWSDGDDFPEMIAKWYVDNGYDFLAITDHNILSQGERWKELSAVEKKAGKTVLEKYRAEFGELVEIRKIETDGKTVQQVRLRTLKEFRGPFEETGKFLLIEAEEISDRVGKRPLHMNATNLRSVIRPSGGKTMIEAINNNLRAAEEQAAKNGQPILVHLNHPNFGWAVTAEELAAVTREKFFEVYNGHPSINHLGDATRPSVERMWDICNTIRIDELKSAPMYGLATDDSHQYHGRQGKKNARTGRGWVVVRAKSLTTNSLIAAMRAGDFYSSSGVEFETVDFDKACGKLSLKIKPVKGQTFKTEFVGTLSDYDKSSSVRLGADGKPTRATKVYSDDVGKVLGASDALIPEYQMTGKELYVRAVVTSSQAHGNPSFKNQKQQAWTQPVVWKPRGSKVK